MELERIFTDEVFLPQSGAPTTLIATAQGQSRDLSGSFEEVETRLDEMVTEWKKLKFGDSVAVQELGTIALNGLVIRLSREASIASVQYDDKGKETSKEYKFYMKASVINPMGGTRYLSESRFATSEALFKLIHARREEALAATGKVRAYIRTQESDLAKTQAALEAAPIYNEGEMERLEKELEVLESDMQKNPYKRMTRAERSRQAALADERAAAEAAGLPVPDSVTPTPEEVEILGLTPEDVQAFAQDAAMLEGDPADEEEEDEDAVQVVTAVL